MPGLKWQCPQANVWKTVVYFEGLSPANLFQSIGEYYQACFLLNKDICISVLHPKGVTNGGNAKHCRETNGVKFFSRQSVSSPRLPATNWQRLITNCLHERPKFQGVLLKWHFQGGETQRGLTAGDETRWKPHFFPFLFPFRSDLDSQPHPMTCPNPPPHCRHTCIWLNSIHLSSDHFLLKNKSVSESLCYFAQIELVLQTSNGSRREAPAHHSCLMSPSTVSEKRAHRAASEWDLH